jgi:hypothetical protein
VTFAALALADVPRYAAAAQRALTFASHGIPLAISGYGPSSGGGAWPEGSGYWCYVTKWLLATAQTLKTATGHDNGYMSAPGVRETAGYALQMYSTPSGDVFNYGDTPDGHLSPDVASNLLGLTARFPSQLGTPALVQVVKAAIRTPPPTQPGGGGWDVVALALMHWPNVAQEPSAPSHLDDLPTAAFYEAQAVGVVRSGWEKTSAYLGARGGNASVTHQDLDHGTFVYESRGYRWVVDLGTENYGLPNMFLPFQGRYRYYRKSTRGHNTLAFRDAGGFDPADAEHSDQAVNVFSTLQPGSACRRTSSSAAAAAASVLIGEGASDHPWVCGAGEVMVVNLTSAYAPQLPNGLPDPHQAARSIVRSFLLSEQRTSLTVIDTIEQRSNSKSEDNVTFGLHTRASGIHINGSGATLVAPTGLRPHVNLTSVPANACGGWKSALVRLPNGTLHNQTRFPLYGAKKLWVVCTSAASELRVTLYDM